MERYWVPKMGISQFFASLKAAISNNIPLEAQSDNSSAAVVTHNSVQRELSSFPSAIVNFIWCFFAYIEYPTPNSLSDEQFLNTILIL